MQPNEYSIVLPFQGKVCRGIGFPGRCPGLICGAPFGAEDGRCDWLLGGCGTCHGIPSLHDVRRGIDPDVWHAPEKL